ERSEHAQEAPLLKVIVIAGPALVQIQNVGCSEILKRHGIEGCRSRRRGRFGRAGSGRFAGGCGGGLLVAARRQQEQKARRKCSDARYADLHGYLPSEMRSSKGHFRHVQAVRLASVEAVLVLESLDKDWTCRCRAKPQIRTFTIRLSSSSSEMRVSSNGMIGSNTTMTSWTTAPHVIGMTLMLRIVSKLFPRSANDWMSALPTSGSCGGA